MSGAGRPHVVRTARLDLVAMTLPLIDAVLLGDLERAAALAPFPVDATTFGTDRHVLLMRQAQLRAEPAQEPWLYRAAVHRVEGVVVGRAGFHAPPDAGGSIEIGYSVVPARRRQGFALEMAVGLLAWGREHGVRRLVASTSPSNVASQAVIARLGLVRVGEQMDELDGFEEVYALELT